MPNILVRHKILAETSLLAKTCKIVSKLHDFDTYGCNGMNYSTFAAEFETSSENVQRFKILFSNNV